MPLVVKGMVEEQRALRHADRDVRAGIQAEYRKVAEPIRHDAETLPAVRIRRIGTKWDKARTRVTTRLVYVAPKQRGIRRGGHPSKRPNFATLMLSRAYEPALTRNAPFVRRDFERMLDTVARRFNRDNHRVV